MSDAPASGGVTAPKGFQAAGVHAGIKASGSDLALIVSDCLATTAGVFTSNVVTAAPVVLCRRALGGQAQAIVINSGNANACTGAAGLADAERMAEATAEALGIGPERVMVCSTGMIGVPLPMDKIVAAIPVAANALAAGGGHAAAEAIMTTDAYTKENVAALTIDGRHVVIGGCAKGAGMIEPNMATMLAFITTDAKVRADAWQDALKTAVDQSFNRITVDGDQSTNDTVLALANGLAGNDELSPEHPDWDAFSEALNTIARELALMIVSDGEGATRVVCVTVIRAADATDARKAVRSVANSLLVKTSWFGGDPNWGRILCALGYSGASLVPERVDIYFENLAIVRGGMAVHADTNALAEVMKRPRFSITIDLNNGEASDSVYSSDCTIDYVRLNSAYTT